jgi:phage shock protein C
MLSGVSGGIAEYFDVDPVLVRLLWVVTAIFSGGLTAILYAVLWIVMPLEDFGGSTRDAVRHNVAEMRTEAQRMADDLRTGWRGDPVAPTSTSATSETVPPTGEPLASDPLETRETAEVLPVRYVDPAEHDILRRRRSNWAGIVLIFIGAMVLAGNLGAFRFVAWHMYWPLLLIVIGGLLLWNRAR